MKLDVRFRFDVYTLIIWLVLFLSIIILFGRVIEFTKATAELDILRELNKEYVFDFDCQKSFDSKFYNCPANESSRNITGLYCQGRQLCANSYRRK